MPKGNIYGTYIMFIGFLTFIPLVIIPFYPEEWKHAFAFIIPGILSFLIGLIIYLLFIDTEKIENTKLSIRRSSIPVLFMWGFGFIIGAIPFVLSDQLKILHALFESVSGWTTTGFSLVDVSKTPRIFLFHRSFMQYCGGLGFVLLMFILVQGKRDMGLYNAEGHPDKLLPSLKKTAQIIFYMYNVFLLCGIFIYHILGMDLFDAVCHTMSALSTAGFTTQPKSIGEYNSFAIEVITILLMFIGSTGFTTLHLLFRFRFGEIFRITELRFIGMLLLIFTPVTAIALMYEYRMDFFEAIRQSLFGIITCFSTTGYSTMDYSHWPPTAIGILMLFMVIGGGVGSTAGGIKITRAYILYQITCENVKNRLFPSTRVVYFCYYRPQGKTTIDYMMILDTVGFISSYLIILFLGGLMITITEDCTLFDAIFEFTSALGTVGISNGLTNATASTGTLIIQMIGMILGRLEIFIFFIGIHVILVTIKNKFNNKS